jgi:hypothetical protein
MIIHLIVKLIAARTTQVREALLSHLSHSYVHLLPNSQLSFGLIAAVKRRSAAPNELKAGAHEKNARQCNSRRRVARRFG